MVCKKWSRSSGSKHIFHWSILPWILQSLWANFFYNFSANDHESEETFYFDSEKCLANIALHHWPRVPFAVILNVRKWGNLAVTFTSAYEIRSNTLENDLNILNNAASSVIRRRTAAFGTVSSDTSSYTLLKITMSSHVYCKIIVIREYMNYIFYVPLVETFEL